MSAKDRGETYVSERDLRSVAALMVLAFRIVSNRIAAPWSTVEGRPEAALAFPPPAPAMALASASARHRRVEAPRLRLIPIRGRPSTFRGPAPASRLKVTP